MTTFEAMHFNYSKQKNRLLTRWVICIPLLVSLLSFMEVSHFIPLRVRIPVQTEVKITPAKVSPIVFFRSVQKKAEVLVSGSFRHTVQCYEKILHVRFVAINSKTLFFKNQSRVIALMHTARNTAGFVIFQA